MFENLLWIRWLICKVSSNINEKATKLASHLFLIINHCTSFLPEPYRIFLTFSFSMSHTVAKTPLFIQDRFKHWVWHLIIVSFCLVDFSYDKVLKSLFGFKLVLKVGFWLYYAGCFVFILWVMIHPILFEWLIISVNKLLSPCLRI